MKPELILVIEDDAAILFGLRENLQRVGYEVRSAGDGHQGLELAQRAAFRAGSTLKHTGKGLSSARLLRQIGLARRWSCGGRLVEEPVNG